MRKTLTSLVYGFSLTFFLLMSCKKDSQDQPLSGNIEKFEYSVNGTSVKLSWSPSDGNFDQFEIQLSKMEDFSVVDVTQQVARNVNEHTFYKLSPAESMYSRIRLIRTASNEQSEWTTLAFSTDLNNILSPIMDEDISNKTVVVKWSFSTDQPAGASANVTRLVIKPTIGMAKEYSLSTSDLTNRSYTIPDITADMKYTVTIYDGNLARGKQIFTTMPVSENGVWTLNPYSNLRGVIAKSGDGDKILLKSGIYDLSEELVLIEDKSLVIEALNAAERPKLYARGFEMTGNGRSMTFNGLDISGARLDEYNTELSDGADHGWNDRLLTLSATSSWIDQVVFKNCIIRNYHTGVFTISDNNRPPHKKGNALVIDNCMIMETGLDKAACLLEINAGELKAATISNSTFYKANKMLIKIDAEKNTSNNVIDFKFHNNTVNNCWEMGAMDFLAVKAPAKCSIQNNIFSNIACVNNFFPNFAYTTNDFHKTLVNTIFYNVVSKSTIYGANRSNQPVHTWELRHPNTNWNVVQPAFIMNDASHANPNSIKEYPVNYDPGFRNEAAGDFTVSSSSPLRSLDGGKAIGDPRWW